MTLRILARRGEAKFCADCQDGIGRKGLRVSATLGCTVPSLPNFERNTVNTLSLRCWVDVVPRRLSYKSACTCLERADKRNAWA